VGAAPPVSDPDISLYERIARNLGFRRVAGVDEAGRGPLAGPVVAAAVVLPRNFRCEGINDSKLLNAAQRTRIARHIRRSGALYAVAACSVEEIDALNIHRAGLEAMRRALAAMDEEPDYLLIDGFRLRLPAPQAAIVKGDRLSMSVMAAGILAKVERDGIMEELDAQHPGYGFARHKGYATRDHHDALRRLGPTPAHRRSFRAVREAEALLKSA
jgi:ribonuclease HII